MIDMEKEGKVKPYHEDEMTRLYLGECRETMAALAPDLAAEAHAVITDPPYELGFMGKSWDASGVAYDPETWSRAMALVRPGGHIAAFSGARTVHRMAVAIEDAGWEIRDTLFWLFSQGFPKSLDVAKEIDKKAGTWRGRAGKVIGQSGSMSGPSYEVTDKGRAVTPDAIRWEGWGTALKPAYEPIVLARRPLEGTVVENVLKHGTGAINIGASLVGEGVETWPKSRSYAPGAMEPGGEGETVATGPAPAGRWPANVLIDCHCDTEDDAPVTHDEDCAVTWVDRRTGDRAKFFYTAKASRSEREAGLDMYGFTAKRRSDGREKDIDNPRLRTTSRKNDHPTVKPVALMRWLIRLLAPPGGTVLDPFMGSGSTRIAAHQEGARFIGIEMDEEYMRIASHRAGQMGFALQAGGE